MKIADQMIKQFEKSQQELIRIIIEKKNRGLVTGHYEEALKRCNDILQDLMYMVNDDVPKMIEEEMHGLKNVLQYQVANNLANNQVGDLIKALLNAQNVVDYVVGRIADDKFRELTLEQVAMINSGGFSVLMATRFLRETLQEEKISCFVDKLGRTWGLNAYSKMAIRTGSRQSRNAGLLSMDDHDLYYVVPIGSTCPICAVLEGRVYSKSGTNPNYPPLTELYGKIDPFGANDLSNTYLTIHPNCRHTLVKWTEATKTEEEIEEMRDKSSFTKHPKDINPQSQKEIEEYRESQRSKARFRATLKEYKELQAEGIEVPKNFQTFINNKENDTDSYNWWKTKYKFDKQKDKQQDNQLVIRFIKTGIVKDEINEDKQKIHLAQTKQEGKSYINCSMQEIKQIYFENRGKGIQYVYKDGSINEIIITKKRLGFIIKKDGFIKKTNIYKIHYSKTGSHIVPKEVLRI